MKYWQKVTILMSFFCLMFIAKANAVTVIIEEDPYKKDVPYIHQVLDMDDDDFWGHNACGPTSSVMITEFHNLQPENNSGYPGWYVYNPYSLYTDKEGNDYDDVGLAYPDEGPYDMGPYPNYIHEHEIQDGAHGFIIRQNSGNWLTFSDRLKTYLENHGLIVTKIEDTNNDYFDIIIENIDAGLPMIAHVDAVIGGNHYGHYIVIIGYDTGTFGTEENVIVHDPYGDYSDTFNGTTYGDEVTYPLDGTAGSWTLDIDWIYTVHPVGVFEFFPGWMSDSNDGLSQAFRDEYDNSTENGGEGINVFGLPFDNDEKGPWVHEWPDATGSVNPPAVSNTDGLYVQDFLLVVGENEFWSQLVLNTEMNKVFPVIDDILEFWHDNTGYSNYGPPIGRQYEHTDLNDNDLLVQAFKKDGVVTYIGYDTVTEQTRVYSFAELFGLISNHALDGNANDETGDYNGTASGVIYGDSVKGQAAYFDGVNDYIDIPNVGTLLNGRKNLTIAFWMKPKTPGAWRNPLSFCQTDSTKFMFEVGYDYADFGIYNSGIKNPYVFVFDYLDDKDWVFVYFTADDDNWYYYLNNELIDSGSTENGANTGSNMHLGKRYGSSSFWKGYLDDIRIYNRRLSDTERNNLYNGYFNN